MSVGVFDFLQKQPIGEFVSLQVILDRWFAYRFDHSALRDQADQLGRVLVSLRAPAQYAVFPTEVGVMLRGRRLSFGGQHASLRLHVSAAMCDSEESILPLPVRRGPGGNEGRQRRAA